MIYVNECPIDWPADLAEREASWEDEPFAFDSLAVAATECGAAEVRVEPLWLAMLGIIGAVISGIGFALLAGTIGQ